MENRPTAVRSSTFVGACPEVNRRNGDGKRVKKTENGETVLYVNRYYEQNLTTGEVTTYYYLGDKLIAQRKGTTLNYIHQDHLTGTSVVSGSTGIQVGTTVKFFPFGSTRSSSVPTDKLFTGQRLDGTGLYYYNARYYDPMIGRFTSPDGVTPDLMNPQSLNKYSYVFNNPLKYNDPTGHWPNWSQIGNAIVSGVKATVNVIKQDPISAVQTVLDVAGMVPVVGEVFDVASGVVSAARGDWVGAGLSLAAAVPVVGNVAGGAKIVKNAVKLADKAAVAKKLSKPHGNTADDRLATLYEKVDEEGYLQKWGVSQDPPTRYGQKELGSDKVRPIETGPRREMLDKERKLVEEFPGPENHEPWAGAAWEPFPGWEQYYGMY